MERVCVRHASQICPQIDGVRVSLVNPSALFNRVRFGTNSVNRMIVSANWSGFMGIRYLLRRLDVDGKPMTPSCLVRLSSHNESEKGINSSYVFRQQSGILDNERKLDPALHRWSVEIQDQHSGDFM